MTGYDSEVQSARKRPPRHPPLTTARIAGSPPPRSFAAARQIGVEWGGRSRDVWEGAEDARMDESIIKQLTGKYDIIVRKELL